MTIPQLSRLLDLSGQAAIVTGGAKGIGEAIVRRFTEAGASVLIVDVDADSGESLAKKLREGGAKASFVRADAGSALARAALFLATPASSYMTGSNLVVDGGYLLA